MDYKIFLSSIIVFSFLLTNVYAQESGSTPPEPTLCITLFDPVCAIDNFEGFDSIQTFSNSCFANEADAKIIHEGECLLRLITQEDAIKISQEIGLERINVIATVSVGTPENFRTVTSQSAPLTGILKAIIPPASLITEDFEQLDATNGRIVIWLDFISNSLTNDEVITNGFIDIHSDFESEGLINNCVDSFEFEEEFTTVFAGGFDLELKKFIECRKLLEESGELVSVNKQFAFAGRGDRENGVIMFEIFNERVDDVLKLSNPELKNADQFVRVDLSQLTFTAKGISYFLNFQDIPITTGIEFRTLGDAFYIGSFTVKNPELEPFELPQPLIELLDQKLDEITNPIANDTVMIVSDDLLEREPQEQSFFQPVIDFFQSIASFFQGLFGGGENGENGGEVPDGVALCIDGIYFGVCTGDQHFDSDQACFGLTTQQCFDKCNVIGTTCRIE